MIDIEWEVLRCLCVESLQPNRLSCRIWLSLEVGPDPNPFKSSREIPARAVLKKLLKNGVVVKNRRGFCSLANRFWSYRVFRERVLAACAKDKDVGGV
jgi:hypothetical protein